MALDDRPVLVAPDSFKGTLSAQQVAAAIGRGLVRAGLPADLAPVADGGEGTMGSCSNGWAARRSRLRRTTRWVARSRRALGCSQTGSTAIVEVAAASGLALLAAAERDAEAASSAGTGELVATASRAARRMC